MVWPASDLRYGPNKSLGVNDLLTFPDHTDLAVDTGRPKSAGGCGVPSTWRRAARMPHRAKLKGHAIMVRFVCSRPRLIPMMCIGGLLLSLSGCVAVPLGQLAYQAATATAKPCATVGDSGGCGPSGLSSIWDGLKAGVAGR